MRTATITEAKNQLSALLDHVRAGESILIMDRGRPVARLEPAVSIDEDPQGRLARLERAGIVGPTAAPFPETILSEDPPTPRDGVSAVDLLLEERREGR